MTSGRLLTLAASLLVGLVAEGRDAPVRAYQVVEVHGSGTFQNQGAGNQRRRLAKGSLLLSSAKIWLDPESRITVRDALGALHRFSNQSGTPPAQPDHETPAADESAAERERDLVQSYVAGLHRGGASLLAPAHGTNILPGHPLVFRWQPNSDDGDEVVVAAWENGGRQIWAMQVPARPGELTAPELGQRLKMLPDGATVLFTITKPGVAASPDQIHECRLLTRSDSLRLSAMLANSGPEQGPLFHLLRAQAWLRYGVFHEALPEMQQVLLDPVHAANPDLLQLAAELANALGRTSLARTWHAQADQLSRN